MPEVKCKTCPKFDRGECHAGPPTIFGPMTTDTRFPQVDPDVGWCAEHPDFGKPLFAACPEITLEHIASKDAILAELRKRWPSAACVFEHSQDGHDQACFAANGKTCVLPVEFLAPADKALADILVELS